MNELTILLVLITAAASFGIAYFVFTKQSQGGKDELDDLRREVSDSIREFSRSISDTLSKTIDQMDKRIADNTNQISSRLTDNVKAIDESKSFLTSRVAQTEKTVRDVTNKLSQLEEASAKLVNTNEEILSFQRMLKVPKVRGGYGELLLENLLADALSPTKYEMQYLFKTTGDRCDAVIKLLENRIVAVDAKFPLENYERYYNAQDENEKKAHFKAFIRDVKNRIDEISSKYISAEENTLNFAMMYIPMEGLYYDIVVKSEDESSNIWGYAFKRKVIPVSPNSFMSYLYTILEGLRGFEIEERAGEILQYLGQLKQDINKFSEDFEVVGKHLNNARSKYEDSSRRLDKLTNRIEDMRVSGELES